MLEVGTPLELDEWCDDNNLFNNIDVCAVDDDDCGVAGYSDDGDDEKNKGANWKYQWEWQ